MKIVTKKVNMPAKVEEFDSLTLEDMQSLVGGYVECIDCGGIDLWLNEEGKLHNLPPNLITYYGDKAEDVVVGDVFFASFDEEGRTVGLTDEQIEDIYKRLGSMAIMHIGNGEFVLAQTIDMM